MFQLNFINALVVGSVFVLILSLWFVGVLLWSMRRGNQEQKLRQRLGLEVEATEEARTLHLWHDGREATTHVFGGIPKRTLAERVARLHRDAGFEASLSTIVMGVGVLALVAGTFVHLLVESVLLTSVTGTAVIYGFWTYLNWKASHRQSLFENQLVDALDLAARSLRAGHPLAAAFKLMAEEIAAPVGTVFREIGEQQSLGSSVETALKKAAVDNDHVDFKLFAVSVAIQLRSGGNLADMMGRVAFVIRDRMRLHRRVRVLTAQTQFSKRILIAIPFGLFIILNVISRDYMETLYTTDAGTIVLAVAGSGLAIGSWLMNKLAVLRY